MARRLRFTGFTRFLIVMIFLVPLAYIGASYYNGQDGLENFKKFVGLGSNDNTTTSVRNSDAADDTDRTAQLHERITELQNELDKKDEEIADLKSRLRKCK